VGFKYFDYEHWNVYLDNTPLEEALKTADFYHKTYEKIKEIYGEYPLPKLLVLGPGFWQAGNTYLRQQLVGWHRYEYIPHHMLHALFHTRVDFANYFYLFLSEGYSTYSEGIMTAEIANDPIWRGMLYERKFHYIRGKKFDNLAWDSDSNPGYVLGFITTFLMDKEIKKQTNNQKGIHDLMVAIWEKYSSPDFVWVSDEQVLGTLKEITGNDWHPFFEKNIKDTSNLDVDSLDELKDDFRLFLKAIADYWYNGSQSMYFVGQEIVSAAGNFDANVRMQSIGYYPGVYDFVIYARKYKDVTQSALTEEDIEEILQQITGKNHSDFFEFYRGLGFNVDPKEITEFAKTFTYSGQMADNAIKLIPNTFPLRKSTNVIGEIVDQDFAKLRDLSLQVQVYDKPIGLTEIQNLITGKGVSSQGKYEFPGGINYFFKLPKIEIGGKTYTFFTINLPEDAGIIRFSFETNTFEKPTYSNWMGAFVGTKKVRFQSGSTFNFKPENFQVIDDTPPIFSITNPLDSEFTTEQKGLYIGGLVEPDATVLINGQPATISDTSFDFSHYVDLIPGDNVIEVEVSDKAGNTTTKTITVTYQKAVQKTIITLKPDNSIMTVNGVSQEIDPGRGTKPVIISAWGRTVVPIRAIVEALGGTISWEGTTRKVTINFKGTTVELWIDNPKAKVNGTEVWIDAENHSVKPIIVNDRTMLPLRFVAESLGCDVGWDNDTRTITITYGG
jgi:hypothetical protein